MLLLVQICYILNWICLLVYGSTYREDKKMIDIDFYSHGILRHTRVDLDCELDLHREYCRYKCSKSHAVCIEGNCYCINGNTAGLLPSRSLHKPEDFPSKVTSEEDLFGDSHPTDINHEPHIFNSHPIRRHHIAHFCPNLDEARKCIRKCMPQGKPAFCGKDHVCYCGHKYSTPGNNKKANVTGMYAQFKDLYEKYFGKKKDETDEDVDALSDETDKKKNSIVHAFQDDRNKNYKEKRKESPLINKNKSTKKQSKPSNQKNTHTENYSEVSTTNSDDDSTTDGIYSNNTDDDANNNTISEPQQEGDIIDTVQGSNEQGDSNNTVLGDNEQGDGIHTVVEDNEQGDGNNTVVEGNEEADGNIEVVEGNEQADDNNTVAEGNEQADENNTVAEGNEQADENNTVAEGNEHGDENNTIAEGNKHGDENNTVAEGNEHGDENNTVGEGNEHGDENNTVAEDNEPVGGDNPVDGGNNQENQPAAE